MRHRLLIASALLTGCTGLTDSDRDRCPQTGEFGNYGCTVLVGRISGVDGTPVNPLSRRYSILMVRVSALQSYTIDGSTVIVQDTGQYRVTLTRWSPPPSSGPDTVSVRLTAVWLDAAPSTIDAPTPILGADTVFTTLRMAPVGARFRVDTINFRLRAP